MRGVVLVDVLYWVGESRVHGRAGRGGPSARLALECRGPQAAGVALTRVALGTEAPVGLMHHLRALADHAGWRRVADEVIDAEHAGLARAKTWRGRRGVVSRGQLLPVGRTHRHVGVGGVGVGGGRPGDLHGSEHLRLMDV